MKVFIVPLIIIYIYIIIRSNIKVELNLKRYQKNDKLTMIIIYGMFKYKKQIPFIDIIQGINNNFALEVKTNEEYSEKYKDDNKSVVNINEFEKIIKKYRRIYKRFSKYIIPFMEHIKEKIKINNINWNTEVGLSDACETAIFTGTIWSIKSTIISFIYNNYNLYNSHINVVPNYNTATFKTSINCIFTIKVGDIITVGLKTLLAKAKDGVKNE